MSYIVTDGANRGIRASGDKSHKFTNEETFLWLNERRRDTRAGSARPHRRCPIIGSPPPRKVSTADNLLAKNSPPGGADFYRQIIGRGRLFWRGRSYNGGFYGAGDILARGRYINFVIIFPRADFSWGRHFNVASAYVAVAHPYFSGCSAEPTYGD